jgi:hypothetical protein
VNVGNDKPVEPNALDLFDRAADRIPESASRRLSPLVPLGQAVQREPAAPLRRTIRPPMVWAAAISSCLVAVLFRFPPVVLIAAPLVGVGVALAWRWRWGVSVAMTVAVSAFLAQATSIFVTPFTWPLRFGFFLVLVATLMLLLAWQPKEL